MEVLNNRGRGEKRPHDGAPLGEGLRLPKAHGVVLQSGPHNLQHIALAALDAFVDGETLEAFGLGDDVAHPARNRFFEGGILAGVDADVGKLKNHGGSVFGGVYRRGLALASVAFDYARAVKLYNEWAHPTGCLPTGMSHDVSQDVEYLVPQWPAPANVRSLCTTRVGGISQGPYLQMNLGTHVGDTPERVQDNRDRLAGWLAAHSPSPRDPHGASHAVQRAAVPHGVLQGAQQAPGRTLAAPPPRAVFMEQVHGTEILTLALDTPDGLRADAAWTESANVACTVLVADCLPVLLCKADGSRVAAVHAGWRGLAGKDGLGALEAVWPRLNAGPGSAAHSGVLAWLGPCIGPSAFEVGDEVRAAFVHHSAEATACFTPLGAGKWLANLPALARQRLRALGVAAVYGNDGSPAWCTVGNPSRFFSYRRDGVTGRMAACIWRSA